MFVVIILEVRGRSVQYLSKVSVIVITKEYAKGNLLLRLDFRIDILKPDPDDVYHHR